MALLPRAVAFARPLAPGAVSRLPGHILKFANVATTSSSRARALQQGLAMTVQTRSASTAAPAPAEIAKLNYIDFNPDVSTTANTPVVIMHGLLGNSRNFQSWGAKLVKLLDRPRRTFAVDMRNHGASSHHRGMAYPDMAADVVAFMKQRGLEKAVLVGHSMGGKAACMTALLHPERVEGLVVMDIAPVPYSVVDQTNWGETQRIIDSIHRLDISGVQSRRDADVLLEKDIVDPGLRAFAVTNLERSDASGKWEWRINVDAIHRSLPALAQFEVQPGLDASRSGLNYGGDTLVIAGGKSRYVRSAHLKQIGALFPRHMLQTLPNAGHWVHADDPAGTINAVKLYLDRPELP